ncbi:Shedu anti-phage system protein SduA domain-containing protein [Candidatus Poribacteria bacterium]
MKIIRTSREGLDYLAGILKEKPRTITRAVFWRIPHDTPREDIRLKIARYNRKDFNIEDLECKDPKSLLTLDYEEFLSLIEFIQENYEPFREGTRRYIPIDEEFTAENIEHVKAIFNNPNKHEVISFIIENNVLSDDLFNMLEYRKKAEAVEEFEEMLKNDRVEQEWQKWFKKNSWVLGTEFVKILEERDIDTSNIADYLMQAYDGFLDIVEIKRPEGDLDFWAQTLDHGNHIPSTDLIKAITQASKYIHEVEREANSLKFLARVENVKTIKPRCLLIFGRSIDWDEEQKEAYRILNSSYHNLTILTYDHVLYRAKRIISNDTENISDDDSGIDDDDFPF